MTHLHSWNKNLKNPQAYSTLWWIKLKKNNNKKCVSLYPLCIFVHSKMVALSTKITSFWICYGTWIHFFKKHHFQEEMCLFRKHWRLIDGTLLECIVMLFSIVGIFILRSTALCSVQVVSKKACHHDCSIKRNDNGRNYRKVMGQTPSVDKKLLRNWPKHLLWQIPPM